MCKNDVPFLQHNKNRDDLYIMIRNHMEDLCFKLSYIYFFFHFTSHAKQSQKLISVTAFNIWRADILIEPMVRCEARGIAGDRPFAVLKS